MASMLGMLSWTTLYGHLDNNYSRVYALSIPFPAPNRPNILTMMEHAGPIHPHLSNPVWTNKSARSIVDFRYRHDVATGDGPPRLHLPWHLLLARVTGWPDGWSLIPDGFMGLCQGLVPSRPRSEESAHCGLSLWQHIGSIVGERGSDEIRAKYQGCEWLGRWE